jgi:hypothetical protein
VEFEVAAWVPIAIASLLVTNTGYPSLGEAVSGRATSVSMKQFGKKGFMEQEETA